MLAVHIEVDGIKEVMARIQDLTTILNSTTFKGNVNNLAIEAEQYWRTNVYTYFRSRLDAGLETSGLLGRSLYWNPYRSINNNGTIEFFMKQIFHTTESGVYEYGRYLRNGANPSPGRYIRKFDRRTTSGEHPGMTNNSWVAWQSDFSRHIGNSAISMVHAAVRREVRGGT